jgi:dCMP deaminase
MIFDDPFSAMQAAVDIVGTSQHPDNKIAATLFGRTWGLSRTNYWPPPILSAFGTGTDIGNASGTVHAETACILQAGHPTEDASLCITDPFCPNCAKNIAEAGIKKIYIDHKGFDKDFFQRRAGHFEKMSMRICEKAGIAVYEIWRKDERLVPIYEPQPNYFISEDSPVYREPIETPSDGVFGEILAQGFKIHQKRKFAVAFVRGKDGKYISLTARGHAVTGFTMEDPDDVGIIERHEEKYSFFQEPVNRLLMYMARHDMVLCEGFFFCSQVPTGREQVNLVGAGIKRISVGDLRKARDPGAIVAMEQLSNAGILSYV